MNPQKKIGFVIDPLEGFNTEAETTLYLMREAQSRGYQLFSFGLEDLIYNQNSIYGNALEIEILPKNKKPFYKILKKSKINLETLEVLLLRKDPPFDLAYLHHLYLLDMLKEKVLMINHPNGILTAQEKIFALQFTKWIPQTVITQKFDEAHYFSKQLSKGIVLKPIHLSGGRGVFHFKPHDSNFKVAFEILAEQSKSYLICHEYLPAVTQGDKRIVLLDGEILGYFLRTPQKGSHRANLHSGGVLKKCTLTTKEKQIAKAVGEVTKKMGLYFVGIDLIGEHLTEINVTSPMGIHEINKTMKIKSETLVMDFIEKKFKSLDVN